MSTKHLFHRAIARKKMAALVLAVAASNERSQENSNPLVINGVRYNSPRRSYYNKWGK